MVKSITAKGIIYGNDTLFTCKPNRNGFFELARKHGRVAGTRPQDLKNKVYAETLDEAWHLLKTEKFYIVLTGQVFGIHRKSLRSVDSVDIDFENDIQPVCATM
ncbi:MULTISPECIES: hypothetical protein [Vibrio]|uniref:Uncharacterized protein n=3 Tax=Vibrio cyclitrophicus TaxID=47951 RepID=A0A7Z1S0C4_9VIBR|nr:MULTISPECIES: hypothetical protein [Vibrio]KNH11004.1 hypothetical protein ACS79_20220 [Vibrio lentus]MBY7659700.1 hypothetical protein [Vibrio atlanticus]ERM58055.1 hypothetical protein M565_ctg5P1026 [Vibrio cyclitrophicus FF75]KAA8602470.1 hypothetical protein F0Z19_0003 [Vibrio cyclitrophicus]MBE8558002.1 hypothetical protein [Vibrio sp. OPT24]